MLSISTDALGVASNSFSGIADLMLAASLIFTLLKSLDYGFFVTRLTLPHNHYPPPQLLQLLFDINIPLYIISKFLLPKVSS